MFYIGSCRYMCDFNWDSFPPRLHTTKEIIYFLQNIGNLKKIIDENPNELINFIFGDIFHPMIKNKSISYINTYNNYKNNKKVILEICSRKVYYYNDIPLSHYYTVTKGNKILIDKYNLKEIILTDEEIENDIIYIIQLCKKIFNENVEIHIIPHLNLKTKNLNNYIPDRNIFVNLLENLCQKHALKIHNIGKYIEKFDKNSYLEDYMSDSTHYSKGFDKVIEFLNNEINK